MADLSLVDDAMTPEAWDKALAGLGGHPLQSSLWGRTRLAVEGRRDHCLAYCDSSGTPQWMIRVEERKVPVLGLVGWAPRGPTATAPADALDMPRRLNEDLRQRGVRLLVSDPYVAAPCGDVIAGESGGRRPRTIWVDLSVGLDATFARLKGTARTAIRSAAKKGVTTVETTDQREVAAFVELCRGVSRHKGFQLNLESEFVTKLMANGTADACCRLFVARRAGALLAGALVMTLGRHWHFFWGGTDRGAGDYRAGDALHWAIMQAAIAAGATRYDLEGVDDRANPTTGAFKRKLGGSEVDLTGQTFLPLGLRGKAMALALAARRQG